MVMKNGIDDMDISLRQYGTGFVKCDVCGGLEKMNSGLTDKTEI